MEKIVSLGSIAIMIPAGAAISVMLAVQRAWKAALLWIVLFLLAIALVVASKVMFMAWGTGIRSIDFKAASGHAMLTAAVYPVLFYLALQTYHSTVWMCGVLLGIVLGVGMGIFLVVDDFHSSSEAGAGCAIGAAVSLGFVRILRGGPRMRISPQSLLCSAGTFLLIWSAEPASLELWMRDIAHILSKHGHLYGLASGEMAW
jgi:4-amino-4-deoxy-L-arabinose transferase-like glycosyltransferase